MLNLPAFSTAMLAALAVADFLILAILVVAAGPVFIVGRDAFGRPLDAVSPLARALMGALLLAAFAYLGVQVAAVWRFLPYYLDEGAQVTERVTRLTVVDDPAAADDGLGTAYWVTTERHRFGVTQTVFRELAVGQLVRARYRAADDTLYEIEVVEHTGAAAPPRP